ncbi:aminodeoxychorismate synthase component I [Saccharophagus sp. K07]|uniref:aminodeoxychorismate synthase component I n=1 Tax=Saccharophagus sp. K07 TaxID=2283636 RepID=UPI0016528BFF
MHRLPIPYPANPQSPFLRLSPLPHCVWLDSGKPGSPLGRYDVMSALPRIVLEGGDEDVMRQVLNAELDKQANAEADLPFCGGWIGYFGYSYRHKSFNISSTKSDPLPPAWFGWYDWALVIDHATEQAQLVFLDTCSEETRHSVQQALASEINLDLSFCCEPFTPDESRQHYLQNLQKTRDYLLAGDCYQVNYTQRFSTRMTGSAIGAYLTLRQAVPSPFAAYIALKQGSVLSVSPERFIQIDGRHALTQPIKGTAPRGPDKTADENNKTLLQQSEKNRAENLMIVDLLRNDFSRNCTPHSVKVPELFEVQSFANVHHLVSTISGELKTEISHPDFILSCFPGGSITGAPKKRSMEIIEELEGQARSVYCGAIGYFSVNRRTDFNIAIRTLVESGGNLYAWAGGGIVVDSDPNQEYEESLHKIGSFLRAMNNKAAEPAA